MIAVTQPACGFQVFLFIQEQQPGQVLAIRKKRVRFFFSKRWGSRIQFLDSAAHVQREREREQQQVKRIPHLCTHTRLLVGELQRTFFRTTKSDPGCIQVPNDWTKGVKSNIFHSQFWYVLAAFTQTCHISVWFEGEGKRSSEWENVNNMSAVIVGGRATKCQQGDRTSYRTDDTFPQKPHCPVCLEILHTPGVWHHWHYSSIRKTDCS